MLWLAQRLEVDIRTLTLAAYAAVGAGVTDATNKKQNEMETADICREILTEEVYKKLNLTD